MAVFFSDTFDVAQSIIDDYGCFNISIINDIPLFIDPFLLFNSQKPKYKKLHKDIINYLNFLKRKSEENINSGSLKNWFYFPEVKQNWLGYSLNGNCGSGLGVKFALALKNNLKYLSNYHEESITKSSHIEKLCLIDDGVGRDNISDLTTNLIKGYLLEYTSKFAQNYIDPKYCKPFSVDKVSFNYKTESWNCETYYLPEYNKDFILLTPKDMLTRDRAWINKNDLYDDFRYIVNSVSNDVLRAKINNYFLSVLPTKSKSNDKEYAEAVHKALKNFPILYDYFIKEKEDNGEQAVAFSQAKIKESEKLFIKKVLELSKILKNKSDFYKNSGSSYEEAKARVEYLKQVIENNDGYKIFYDNEGNVIKREKDFQILFKLVWCNTTNDFNCEVNNGRGSVDFKISCGRYDKTLVEFKLASNSKFKKNLANQTRIYEKANDTGHSIKVILFFTVDEYEKIQVILKKLNLEKDRDIYLIDASNDKPSASNA